MHPRILLLETASRRCDVAYVEGDRCVAEKGSLNPQGFQHAEKLHVYIQEVLRQAGMRVADLDAIALSAGPGSYTGLRIGASAAKGLVAPHGLPLIAYSSLEALAVGARETLGNSTEPYGIWAAMDARRMEVYSALFAATGERWTADAPQLLEEAPILEGFPEGLPIYGVGDGVEKAQVGWPALRRLPLDYAQARHGAPLALRAWEQKDFVDAAAFTPYYLKAFRAGVPRLGLPKL